MATETIHISSRQLSGRQWYTAHTYKCEIVLFHSFDRCRWHLLPFLWRKGNGKTNRQNENEIILSFSVVMSSSKRSLANAGACRRMPSYMSMISIGVIIIINIIYAWILCENSGERWCQTILFWFALCLLVSCIVETLSNGNEWWNGIRGPRRGGRVTERESEIEIDWICDSTMRHACHSKFKNISRACITFSVL